ncbi:MAG TPA: DUF1707 domain-containing protein [Streptosporangiaceae bacterium]|jgi:hypothetical protein|nr:DUF1707 domain-containing protein [Streptosporangiaceae bacterium]
MSFGSGPDAGAGAGSADPRDLPGGLLASAADRDATQAILEAAFAEQRLTQEEFEARVGRAMTARTEADLAQLIRDLPRPAAPRPAGGGPGGRAGGRRPGRRGWLVAVGAAVVLAGAAVGISQLVGSGHGGPGSAGPSLSSQSGQATGSSSSAGGSSSSGAPGQAASAGPAGCPVGTSPTALGIANALARDPVWVDPSSPRLTPAQARKLAAEIARDNPGRIRIAVASRATVRRGGGFRALANAIANCRHDAAGTTLVNAKGHSYLVTSYNDFNGAAQAVQAALNTHASLVAGLRDAVGRLTSVDNAR